MSVLFPRLYPFSAALWRRLRGTMKPFEIVEIHPQEVLEQQPVIFDPKDWDLVTAVQYQTSEKIERQRLAGGLREHSATFRYLLRNVLVTPVGIFRAGEASQRHGPIPWRRILKGHVEEYEVGFFPATATSLRYFGHFINDVLPSTLLIGPGERLVLPYDPRWSHASAWLRRLSHTPDPQPLAFYRKLWVCDDRGMNKHRHARTKILSSRIMGGLPKAPHVGIYLRRGGTGAKRSLINDAEVSDFLAARGFRILDIENDADTLLREISGVRTVITMEGSNWVHAHFAAGPGALIVTLNPADRFNNIAADMVPALEQRLATMVVEGREGSYHCDLGRLAALLDRAQSEILTISAVR